MRHYSDFGGCQVVMDRIIIKQRSIASCLAHIATSKKPQKSIRCVLVFTSREMLVYGTGSKVNVHADYIQHKPGVWSLG